MSAIVKNIKSMWNLQIAENIVKAVKREFGEFRKGWKEAEAFCKEHPQMRIQEFQY